MPPAPNANNTRFRAVLFTWNNYPAGYVAALDALDVAYIVAGEERAPGTGTPHLQGILLYYFHFRICLFPKCQDYG